MVVRLKKSYSHSVPPLKSYSQSLSTTLGNDNYAVDPCTERRKNVALIKTAFIIKGKGRMKFISLKAFRITLPFPLFQSTGDI
jgi:hypothetical protein